MPVRSCFAEGSFTGLAAARPALPLHRRFASPPNWRRQVRRRPSVVGGTPPSLGRRSRGRRVGCATDRRHGGPPPRSPTWPSPVLWWLCAERQCADCGSAGDPALVSVLPSDGWLSPAACRRDRKSTRLNSSHQIISYAVFCLKKKNKLSITRVFFACSRASLKVSTLGVILP